MGFRVRVWGLGIYDLWLYGDEILVVQGYKRLHGNCVELYLLIKSCMPHTAIVGHTGLYGDGYGVLYACIGMTI